MNLAEVVEGIETELIYQLNGFSGPVRGELAISGRRFGRGIALSIANDPSDFWSKAQGFGFDRPVTDELIGEVVDFYRAAGTRVANIHLAPEVIPAGWDAICAKYGIEQHGTLLKAARENSPAEPVETSLRIDAIDAADTDALRAWADVQVEAFQMPDPDDLLAKMLAAVATGSRFTPYAAWDGDRVVATAALYAEGEAGQLVSAATLPEYRGRGAQSALIARRVEDGLAAGVRWFSVEVSKPAEGEQNPSLDNLERGGFKVLYERPIWNWKA
jgi:ribosomal protein S18 acetylase RimI-like enzyme